MDFTSALNELKAGNKITRPVWKKDNIYLKVSDDESKQVRCYILATSLFSWDASILLSEGWVVKDVDGNEYNDVCFDDVVKQLMKGGRAKLNDWDDKYIEMDIGIGQVVYKHYVNHQFTPDITSFIADDWEVYEQ